MRLFGQACSYRQGGRQSQQHYWPNPLPKERADWPSGGRFWMEQPPSHSELWGPGLGWPDPWVKPSYRRSLWLCMVSKPAPRPGEIGLICFGKLCTKSICIKRFTSLFYFITLECQSILDGEEHWSAFNDEGIAFTYTNSFLGYAKDQKTYLSDTQDHNKGFQQNMDYSILDHSIIWLW